MLAAPLFDKAADAAKTAGDATSAAVWYSYQAQCLFVLHLYKPVLAASDKAIEADNTFWGGWYYRGSALGKLGRAAAAAAQSVQEALNRDPPGRRER